MRLKSRPGLGGKQMSDWRGRLARAGEEAAASFLQAQGLRILERNYRCPVGEIDLVAVVGRTLVIVEVKTRSGTAFGRPAEAVTPTKQSRLRRLAAHYLAERNPPARQVRFDVVEVLGRPGAFTLEHLEDAF